MGYANAAEWQAVGLWFTKVLLLLGHPQARYEHPKINDTAVRFEAGTGTPDLSWLINRNSPPADLSLWVYNASLADSKPEFVIPTPRIVFESDGASVNFHFLEWSANGLCVTLLSHPGWPVMHPLVERQEAWELLHDAPDGDISAMRQRSSSAIAWLTFMPTLAERMPLGSGLPPLRAVDGFPAVPEIADVVAKYVF